MNGEKEKFIKDLMSDLNLCSNEIGILMDENEKLKKEIRRLRMIILTNQKSCNKKRKR